MRKDPRRERPDMTEAGTNSRPPNTGLRATYALFAAVMLAFGLHALFISGPAMRAAAQEHLERTIADEDRSFCEQFGVRPGTTEFVACSRELVIVRQKQTDRDSAAAQGIL